MKTYFFWWVPPVGFDLQFPEKVINQIPWEKEFFEFPDAISATLDTFRKYLTQILSWDTEEKIAIVSLSWSASFLMQSKDILEKYKDKIAWILLLNPVVSYWDIPQNIIRKERLLWISEQVLLSILSRTYWIPISIIKWYLPQFSLELFRWIIHSKISVLKQFQNTDVPFLDVDFPIVSYFTADDNPNWFDKDVWEMFSLCQEIVNEFSPLFRALIMEWTLSRNYTPLFANNDIVSHWDIRRFPKQYAWVMKIFYDTIREWVVPNHVWWVLEWVI